MKRMPVGDDLVGKRVATEITIESEDPQVQHSLRFPPGKKLTKKDINRLRKTNLNHVCVRDRSTIDLFASYEDDDLKTVREDTLQDLETFIEQTVPDLPGGREPSIDYEQIRNRVRKLIDRIQDAEFFTAFSVLNDHHPYTARHSFDVCWLALGFVLTRAEFFDEATVDHLNPQSLLMEDPVQELGLGGLLHDLGKWTLPESVLQKPTRLNEEEWKQVEDHPVKGYEILAELDETVSDAVLYSCLDHHETPAGTGYPMGKSREDIHFYGRILRVCDVYSALTSNRPYGIAVSPRRAREKMKNMQGHYPAFDSDIFQEFLQFMPPFPVGQRVTLSEGSTGIVVDYDPEDPRQAVVRIGHPKSDEFTEDQEIKVNVPDAPTIVS